MNKKISIIVAVVCAVIIIFGVVSIFITDVGGIEYGNGESIVIINDIYSDEEFTTYIDSVDDKAKELGLFVANKQKMADFFDNVGGYSYDFLNPDEEKLTEFKTFLEVSTDSHYVATTFDNTTDIKVLWMAAIGVGVALVLQFILYVIFQKSTNGVKSGLVATIVTVVAGAVTFGLVCICALCGVKAALHSITAVASVMILSILTQAVVFVRAAKVAEIKKLEPAQALEQSFGASTNLLNILFVVIQVSILAMLIVGSYAALPFVLPAFIGVSCLMFIQKYLLPIIYNALI